jgi:hypothetical protein
MNKRTLEHNDMFDDDYGTVVFNDIKQAVDDFTKKLNHEQALTPAAGQEFARELINQGTVLVVTYGRGNHYNEPNSVYLLNKPGGWNDVSAEDESDIKEYLVHEYMSQDS